MVDWQAIKAEYITTYTSYRKLAAKYKVSQVSIVKHSKDEQWINERKRYLNETLTKSLQKASETEIARLEKLMTAANNAVDVAVNAFEDDKQFNRYLVDTREKYSVPVPEAEDENGKTLIEERQWTEEKVFNKIDTKALKDLTSVLKDLTGLMRDFYNMPTPSQAEAQRIAGERLELDRKRICADSVTDTTVIVDMADDVEEYSK